MAHTKQNGRDEFHKTIERALKLHAATQVNLVSTSARTTLADTIAEHIQAKFYVIPFASQETFE